MSCSCTPHTSLIKDGSVTTATGFLKACFREMGAMSEFREQPLTADIPKEFPKPEFHAEEEIARVKQDLLVCRSFTEKDWQERVDENIAEYAKKNEESKREMEEFASKLTAIKEKIEEWDCGPEYDDLKKFALHEIEISMPHDTGYYDRCIAMWKGTDPKRYGENTIKELEKDLKYYEGRLQEEKNAYEERVKYITGFHECLEKLEGK